MYPTLFKFRLVIDASVKCGRNAKGVVLTEHVAIGNRNATRLNSVFRQTFYIKIAVPLG